MSQDRGHVAVASDVIAVFPDAQALAKGDADASDAEIRVQALKRIWKLLKQANSPVRELYVEDDCSVEEFATLREAAGSPNCRLQTIVVSGGVEMLDEISSMLVRSRNHITRLGLNSCSFEQANLISPMNATGMTRLKDVLISERCRLEDLSLGLCALRKPDVLHLRSILSHPANRIRRLALFSPSLSSSTSSAESAATCFEILMRGLTNPNCKMETLRIGMDGFNDRDATQFAMLLSDSGCRLRSLTIESLSMSDLTDRGMRVLLAALRKSSLRNLQLPYSMQVSTKLQAELAGILDILRSDWYSFALAALSARHRAVNNMSPTMQNVLETGDIVERVVRWSWRLYSPGFSSKSRGNGRDGDDDGSSDGSSSSSSSSGEEGNSSDDTSDEDYESNDESDDDDSDDDDD